MDLNQIVGDYDVMWNILGPTVKVARISDGMK